MKRTENAIVDLKPFDDAAWKVTLSLVTNGSSCEVWGRGVIPTAEEIVVAMSDGLIDGFPKGVLAVGKPTYITR